MNSDGGAIIAEPRGLESDSRDLILARGPSLRPNQLPKAEGRNRLTFRNAGCTLVALEPLSREDSAHVNGVRARVGYGNPSVLRNKYYGARTSDRALVADGHCGATVLEDDDLF